MNKIQIYHLFLEQSTHSNRICADLSLIHKLNFCLVSRICKVLSILRDLVRETHKTIESAINAKKKVFISYDL